MTSVKARKQRVLAPDNLQFPALVLPILKILFREELLFAATMERGAHLQKGDKVANSRMQPALLNTPLMISLKLAGNEKVQNTAPSGCHRQKVGRKNCVLWCPIIITD